MGVVSTGHGLLVRVGERFSVYCRDKFKFIIETNLKKRQLLDRQMMYKIRSIWVVAYDLIWVEKRKN